MMQMPAHIKNDPLYSRNWGDIHFKDKNVLIIIVGGTGDCKSGSGITIADDMDIGANGEHRFSLDRIVVRPEDFMKLVRSNLPKGSVIIWDEVGVEHDAREYYETRNRLVNKVMRTFRLKNLIVIMTTPTLKDLDVGTRRLLHILIIMQGQLNRNCALGKIRWVTTDPITAKSYFKIPRFYINGKKLFLNKYIIRRPPAELEKEYKQLKKKETEAWHDTWQEDLLYMRQMLGEKLTMQKDRALSISELEKKALEEKEKYFDYDKKKFIVPLLEEGLKISGKMAQRLGCLLNIKVQRGEIQIKDAPPPSPYI